MIIRVIIGVIAMTIIGFAAGYIEYKLINKL